MIVARRDERGITGIEVLVAALLLTIITAALSTAFINGFGISASNRERIRQSDDAQNVTAILMKDAQSAGGTDPTTAAIDTTLGVSKTDDGGCTTTTSGASLVLRFKWLDRYVDSSGNQTSTSHVANWYFVASATKPRIERTVCIGGGSPATATIGHDVQSASATCDPSCSAANPLPDMVSLTVTGISVAPVPGYQYTVTASLRPDGQTPPCSTLEDPSCPSDSGSPVPLLALGGATCFNGVDGVTVGGSTDVHVYGGVIINANNPACNEMQFNGHPTYTSGDISLLNGGNCSGCPFGTSSFPAAFADPFAGLTPPPDTCGTGLNPATTVSNGITHYHPGTYPTNVTVSSSSVVFDTGIYVFCAGLSVNGGSSATTFTGPTVTTAGAMSSMTVTSASSFNSAGGTLLLQHGATPFYFTYTGVSGNTITGLQLVAGQSATQFTSGDPVSAATSSGPGGVLFYFKNGPGITTSTFAKSGGATVAFSPMTTGDYAGLLVWQDKNDTWSPMAFNGNGPLNLNGTVYAPSIEVQLNGTVDTAVKSIIAASITFGGNHSVGVGEPPPQLVIFGPSSLPDATAGTPYPCDATTTITASGGSGFNTFSASGLPAGMSINASTGRICGTPSIPGPVSFTVADTDSFNEVATRGYTINVNGPLTILTGSLPDWTVTFDYHGFPMSVGGGTSPYTWSASGLPTGLSITSAGVIVGTPTATGPFTPTITVRDNAGATKSRGYTVQINDLPVISGPSLLPDWTATNPGYSQTVTATQGTAPYSWAASGLPPGLTIAPATGVISGTPTTAGTYSSIAVTMTDTAGSAVTKNYAPVTINPALGIPATTLPNGENNRSYSYQATASGGTPPYTWVTTATNLPPGYSISTSGLITGTTTTLGTRTVHLAVHDSTNASFSRDVSLTIVDNPTIGPATLPYPAWTVNRDYPGTAITASGGISPLTWSQTGLPTGMSMDASGVISGNPTTVAGSPFTVVVTLTDSTGYTTTKNYSLTLNASPLVTTSSLPTAEQGVSYTPPAMTASGGTAPLSWSANGLTGLGLSMNSSGNITGTPNTTGTFSVTVTVTDAAGAANSQPLTLKINPPPVNNLVLSDQTGGASMLTGTIVYYKGATAGSFTITNAVTNTTGGAASSSFPALGGTATGWSHTASVVSTPSGGPYVSNTFSWTAGTSSSPTEAITGTDGAGDTVVTALAFVNDSTAPSPTIASPANNSYGKTTTPAINGTAGTNVANSSHSGDATSVTVQIYAGPTATGSPLQTFSPAVAAGNWSVNESPLAANEQYTVKVTQTDDLGNTGSATSTFVIDTVAPTVTASMSNGGGSSRVTVSGTAGNQAANATHSADAATVSIAVCTQANYTGHGNTCAAGWAAFTSTPSAATGSYTATSGNIGNGTYYATVTQSDGAGNVGTFTTGPFVR
jgi:hypothetical protein